MIDKKRGTDFSLRDATDLLENVPSELDKYVIDKELQHTDDFIFCVALFAFCFVLDKIR
jgi:hypothetical protein